jgi:hypothetical protein
MNTKIEKKSLISNGTFHIQKLKEGSESKPIRLFPINIMES